MSMRALVIETPGDRGALAGCRALHEAGWTVGVARASGLSRATLSNRVRYRHRIHGAGEGVEEFIADLRGAIERRGYRIVFPGWGDSETMAISLHRDRLGAIVPLAAHRSVATALDKLELSRLAAASGLEAPATFELGDEALERLDPPLVVKSRSHGMTPAGRAQGHLGVVHARTASDAASAARRMQELGGTPILQESLSGRLMAQTFLCGRDAQIISRTQQVADRIWPPGSGVSARAVTVPVDEQLAARSQRLLEAVDWFGLAELQFIVDADRGPVLIDFNPRFYGSMALAIAAGPNLPALWATAALGDPVERTSDGRSGIAFQWLEGNVRSVMSDRDAPLPSRLLRTVRETLRPSVRPLWSLRDPGPAALAAAAMVRRLVGSPLRLPGRAARR